MIEKVTCPIVRAAASLMPCRGRPRAQDVEQVGARILDAAWAVLLDCGPEGLTLDKVAAAARASKQTIYARHEGKRALLLALLERRVAVAAEGLDVLSDLPTLHAAFADLLARVMDAFNAPEKVMLDRVIDWIDSHDGNAQERPTRVRLADQFRVMIEGHLETAAARWGLKIADRPTAARFWLYGVIGHMRCAVEGDVEPELWALGYTEYFLRAVAGIEPERG